MYVKKKTSRLDHVHSIHEVFQRPSERVAQAPRMAVRVLPLQQWLLAAAADPAVHSCEQEAENP